MKSYLAGQDLSIEVLFEQDLDTVVPDTGSVTYDLYDNGGSKVASAIAVTTSPTSTSVQIPVLAALNAKAPGLDFELRSMVVNWRLQGGARQTQITYRLMDFVLLGVNPASARALVGMSRDELPDEDLDMFEAYVDVKNALGASATATALSAGDKTTLSINRAIAVRSLINVLGSIEMRAIQQDKSNTAQVSRFAKVDFVALRGWLTNLYNTAIGVIVPAVDTSAGMTIGVTLPTIDPVTAAAPVTPGSDS